MDIPIGLPEEGERACDRAASNLLGNRSSSVFSIPCRDAVKAEDYHKARKECGGSLGSQSWWLFPRINEVDVFLQTVDEAKEKIYESHPEVCFAVYEGHSLSSKSTSNGQRSRLDIIADRNEELHDEIEETVNRGDDVEWHKRISRGRTDDVIDAAVLAATAKSIELGPRESMDDYPALPDEEHAETEGQEEDTQLGIPIEIITPERGGDY